MADPPRDSYVSPRAKPPISPAPSSPGWFGRLAGGTGGGITPQAKQINDALLYEVKTLVEISDRTALFPVALHHAWLLIRHRTASSFRCHPLIVRSVLSTRNEAVETRQNALFENNTTTE